MKIFSNGYFELEYDPSSDIIFMALPDMQAQELSEARMCFEILEEHIRNYHVGNLLLDSSKAAIGVGEAEYNRLIYHVSMNLKKTRLKKVARVVSVNANSEDWAVRVQGEVLKREPSSYQIRNFRSRELALEWLTAKPSPL